MFRKFLDALTDVFPSAPGTKIYKLDATAENVVKKMQRPLNRRSNAAVIRRCLALGKIATELSSYTPDGKNILKVVKSDGTTIDVILND